MRGKRLGNEGKGRFCSGLLLLVMRQRFSSSWPTDLTLRGCSNLYDGGKEASAFSSTLLSNSNECRIKCRAGGEKTVAKIRCVQSEFLPG